MLNKMKIVLAGAAAVAAMSSSAAFADTESATATVQILGAVELTKNSDLDLGVVAAGAAGGTVFQPPAPIGRMCSGVTCVGASTPAQFTVTSAANGAFISITHSPSTTLTGPGADMPLNLTASTFGIIFNSAAPEPIFVGGSLAVGANQVAGTYTGSFNVTAEYQ